MDNTLIAERVGIGLSKANVTDLQQRKRKRKVRHRYLPPVQPKSNVQFRPSLDHRMPTLGNNTVFCLHLNQPRHSRLSQEELKHLETQPPRHLHEIRTVLSRELETVGKELVRLERKYYSIHRSLSSQLTKYVPALKSLMISIGTAEIGSTKRVEEIFKKMAENKDKFKEHIIHITVLKDVTNKIKDFVPGRFSGILEHCWKIFNLLDKYCVSFHKAESDVTVDTVEYYHEQISCWRETILKNLENVMKLSRQFRNDGVKFQSMSSNVIQVGQQHHCSTMPLLLIFPECCANIRNTSYAMTSWVKTDEDYCTFLRNDVFDLEKKKENTMRLMREARERFHSVVYKLAQAECECAKLSTEVAQLRNKEDSLEQEEQFLANRTSEMELEIDVKGFRRRELHKCIHSDPISLEMWEELGANVRFMKEKVPFVKRQLSNVRYKLAWIRGRSKALEVAEREVNVTKRDLADAQEEKEMREKEYVKIKGRLEMARKIHMFKTTPGAAEKLFYGLSLDVSSSKNSGLLPDNDPLTRACEVVASLIQQDWNKLYRNLPFVPLRGQVTIEQDIRNIGRDANRLALSNHASRALVRWRRFHTRATVEDLLESLRKIKRYDILLEVDMELNPPQLEVSDEEDDKNLPVGPELVPFYRQVERYDKIRAAKKVQQVNG